MSVGEESATSGQSIDIRRLGHGVRIQASDPIVLIINRDEEDVRFVRWGGGASGCFRAEGNHAQRDQEEGQRFHLEIKPEDFWKDNPHPIGNFW